ncbi:Thiamine pyrophosphate-requiring enzymes [hydrothermal vent metagenome]|uniref:Thiamine pyrophosphate-requiring enzymes n=1 Tax=hydrothermal vent metagenome TaxID=652676 RepID=A0A3B0R6H8_9ZZZZ
MFAAESLVKTLLEQGVEVCFTNPGTSEMHMVAALDRNPQLHSVLCLFEGVATGAADGYGRMADKPACTLLHLGPGLANGLANLHNARRAKVPVVNIVGDHATDHLKLDAPLTSDIEGFCAPVSRWTGRVSQPTEVSSMAVEAVLQSYGPKPGVASLILPADCAWSDQEPDIIAKQTPPKRKSITSAHIAKAAAKLTSARNPVLYLGDLAVREAGLFAAGRIAKKLGCRVIFETFAARISRGEGRFSATRLNYFGESALEDMKDCDLLLVAGSKPPVSFFAYPDVQSDLTPPGADVFLLGDAAFDSVQGLTDLADVLDSPALPDLITKSAAPPLDAEQPLNPGFVGLSLLRHMPGGSVICDDATTSGMGVFPWLENGPAHEWLCLTGGAIGIGMPMAVGAALACPDKQIFALCGDGAAAYTCQALWTQAREKQNIINVVFANHSYLILNFELDRVGAGEPGPAAKAMLDLSNPKMDWVALGTGFGVASVSTKTAGEFDAALVHALATPGPHLIVAEI